VGEVPVPGRPVSGGPANATERLVRGLVEAGLDVTVVAPAPDSEPARTLDLHGARVLVVAHEQRLMVPRRMRPWRKAATPLVEALGADIVHGQGVVTGGVIAAGVSPSVGRVVTARGNARRDALAAYSGAGGRVRAALGDRLIKWVIDRVDVTIDVHPDWRTNLPCEPRVLVHIPNIVDDAFFRVQRSPIRGRVLYCGGTRRIKGFDVLAAAWPDVRQAVPNASLRLVGWPEAIAPSLTGAEATGVLGPTQLAEEMALAHVVVIPSRYEVSPILLAEAWAARTPVVSTDAGGMGSLAPGAALVVPSDSPAALGPALVGLLTDTVDSSQLVATGRDRAERHRASSVVAAHVSLYNDLVRSA
jgi:glycosyltransferase involved in cell wall biosynthesis